MSRRIGMLLITVAMALMIAMPVSAYEKYPGKGKTINPGRATWTTGFFQEALIRKAFEELGYKVKRAKDLQNPIFYQSLALGDVDYWANGWFPNHDSQLPKNFYEKGDTVGYIVKAGGLQGYLVSKKEVDKFGIKSLEDFKRPEVMKAFDKNRDGKADLVACPPGWGCEKVIGHHMDVYDLDDSINLVKASYSASMAETVARYQNGEPVFFYTWAPNWTTFRFKPGEDVMWINVPFIDPLESQKPGEDRMTVEGVEGAVSSPVKLGFVVSDIQVVANKAFMGENPAARRLFELVKLPLVDISEQNTRMFEGEDSAKDIAKHVDEWVANNQALWDSWLEEARKAAK
ncbi:glycine betaine ABC transporter substrate-binding protein [Desulfoluna limicola]|uniref:Glycine betaine ABC transporter substrate-binding protein n=1 Tax=Desulfoluna limicola TaxID=2810562 RepID=A0ABN6F5Y0_9BACT|nr:glycine betaine/L-proline ABC transporter substrate-binding protein ProX [Desulfoluna limicola]BCS97036.1 glycine betaine ABC transporter substrate-binding protein [Desulfoluna limicola]